MELLLHEILSIDEKKLILGKDVKKYEIGSRIGSGVSCTAYDAEDMFGANVVIKVYPKINEDEMLREAELFISLRNQSAFNTLRIMGIYKSEETEDLYVVQDRMQGMLYLVNTCPLQSLTEELDCIISLIKTLQDFNEAGYLLMDIKPENLFKVKERNELVLFDLDSAVRYDHIEDDLKYVNKKYMGHEIIDETYPIGVHTCIYAICSILFERLFRKMPDNQLKQKKDVAEKVQWVRSSCLHNARLLDEEVCVDLYDILSKELNYFPFERSATFNDLLIEISELQTLVRRKEIESLLGKRYNITISDKGLAYHHIMYRLLDEYPVYKYSEEGGPLNILISAGQINLAIIALQAVISCVQMLDRKLNIYMTIDNPIGFWNTVTDNNKELRASTKLYIDEICKAGIVNKSLVDHEIANIYLYSENNQQTFQKLIVNKRIRYLMLLNNSAQTNIESILYLGTLSKPAFVAYYGALELDTRKLDTFCIPKNAEGDVKEAFRSSYLYRNALQIHNFYCQGLDSMKARRLREAEFMNSPYYIQSSERVFVHLRYKLQSIGLDINSEDVIERFEETVLSNNKQAKAVFDRLVYLEHFCWTAYMIVNGFRKATLKEFRQYAYRGVNDWKKMDEFPHIKHPCMVSSRPGNVITEESWEEEDLSKYDELDRVSIQIHHICKEIAIRRYGEIQECLRQLEVNNNPVFPELERVTLECFSFADNLAGQWQKVIIKYMDSKDRLHEDEDIKKLITLMLPVLEAMRKRNFKKSDEDSIRSIPILLRII